MSAVSHFQLHFFSDLSAFKQTLKMPKSKNTMQFFQNMWEVKKWMSISTVPLLSTAFNVFIVENYISLCIIKPIQNDCFLWSRSPRRILATFKITLNSFYRRMLSLQMSCRIFLFLPFGLLKLPDTVYSLYIKNIFVY